MAVLSCKNLKFLYSVGTPFETAAVDDVSFEIESGDTVGLIGHTGSGKSTLIQHLNGLLEPHSGEVYVDGENIWSKENKKKIRQVRFKVGLCFQYPEYQIFEEDVFKEIAFGPKQMGLSEEEIKNCVFSAMDYVGIDKSFASKSPFDLSGGQKRRIAIASVISMNPQILILDEPCAGLDPIGRDKILDLINNYRQKTGKTVVFVSHSMEDVAKICNKVLVMNNGKVEMFGSVAEVYSHCEQLKNIGLNVPEITDVFLNLKQKGINCKTDIYTVEDGVEEFLRLKSEGVTR